MYKKIMAVIYLLTLFLPMILCGATVVTDMSVDVELKGFTDNAVTPVFSKESFSSGAFQNQLTAWIDEHLPLRGVITKTYATLRYRLFSMGNRPVGKNGDIFESDYINARFGIGDQYDFSIEENQKQMAQFVDTMVSVQEKLKQYGKFLYVYIAPSKAEFHTENVPEKYKNMASGDFIAPLDYFREQIAKTDIPYLICNDMRNDLEYPAFYTTGIHWSRTFEQETSSRIVSELAQITGKQYRNLLIGDVKESTIPYGRDTDVYDLLNVWGSPDETYYEYELLPDNQEQCDSMRYLIYGDSFAQGLRSDILGCYPNEDILYINRDNYILDAKGSMTMLNHSWDTIDWNYCLATTDVVIIEMIEPVIKDYTLGFIDYLNTFLDGYEDHGYPYAECIDMNSDASWPSDSLKGVYHREAGFIWAKPLSVAIIRDFGISETGLELAFVVPGQVFHNGGTDTIAICVNGVKLYEQTYSEGWNGSVFIEPETLKQVDNGDGVYTIEISCSSTFIPKELGINDDTRELAIQILYIGRTR